MYVVVSVVDGEWPNMAKISGRYERMIGDIWTEIHPSVFLNDTATTEIYT